MKVKTIGRKADCLVIMKYTNIIENISTKNIYLSQEMI